METQNNIMPEIGNDLVLYELCPELVHYIDNYVLVMKNVKVDSDGKIHYVREGLIKTDYNTNYQVGMFRLLHHSYTGDTFVLRTPIEQSAYFNEKILDFLTNYRDFPKELLTTPNDPETPAEEPTTTVEE